MARSKVDPQVAKQAKQKKILIGLSVVLVAVLAIQLPKLLSGPKGSTQAVPGTTTPGTTTPAPGTAGVPTPTPTPAPVTGPTTLVDAGAQQAGKAQLASFSLFKPKDPFVPQIKVPTTGAGTGTSPGAPTKNTPKGGTSGAGGSKGGGQPATFDYATIAVNGVEESVAMKTDFPADGPLFRLVSVGPKGVKIGIAGGALANGKTVTLKKGAKLTLVDTATGARYTLQLLYTGAGPEKTATFTSGQDGAAPSGSAAAPLPTGQTTTTP